MFPSRHFPARPGLIPAMALALSAVMAGAGEPYVPESEDLVLVRLSSSAVAPALPRSRPAESTVPASLSEALEQARACTAAARREGDPRHLSRAQQHLAPWWDAPQPTTGLRLERARIRQGLHQFASAEEDVKHCLRDDPRSADAWLLAASMALVRGDYAAVRRACLPLARLSDPLIVLTLSAAVRSLEDPLSDAERPLAAELRRRGDAPPDLRAWAWTTLGEIQARLPDIATAEQSFRTALALEPDNVDTLACLADALLDARRPADVVELLRERSHPALRLRLTEAASRLDSAPRGSDRWSTELEESFALDEWRGDNLHRREHARFLLRLRHDPSRAFEFARSNWTVQKEPADARILVEAATAANRLADVSAELAWIQAHQPGAIRSLPTAQVAPASREPSTRP